MQISQTQCIAHNEQLQSRHTRELAFLAESLSTQGIEVSALLAQLSRFQVAIPSWALGAGGTRFGRFSIGGEPRNLAEKIEDVGLLHQLTQSAGSISLHIPWDIPEDPAATREQAAALGLRFDAVNSNTFQDQPGQTHSYKFGSLSHSNKDVREQAIAHNQAVIDYGKALGSQAITVWLADGSSFPGQNHLRKALSNTRDSLQHIYAHLPEDWQMLIEYKPYEPHFYSTVIQDWGTSLLLAQACGPKAQCLVDLGHHLPNTNIEQIVATLMLQGKLGGFHFNDSKYGDDDLTVGAIKPYQLFLIFCELVSGMRDYDQTSESLAWMIDASHNLKDPLEDLIQSLEAIRLAYAQALIVDYAQLAAAQAAQDLVQAQEILQAAFRTDLRPLLREARLQAQGAIAPLELYRSLKVRQTLINTRGQDALSTGL